MNPVMIRQRYLKVNAKEYESWIKIFGQEVSVFRFIKSEIPNVDMARRVFGSDRVTSNITKLTPIKNIKIPVAFDDLINAHAKANVTLEFALPSDELEPGDIIQFDFLGKKLEFVVEGKVNLNLETLFGYTIRTRDSKRTQHA